MPPFIAAALDTPRELPAQGALALVRFGVRTAGHARRAHERSATASLVRDQRARPHGRAKVVLEPFSNSAGCRVVMNRRQANTVSGASARRVRGTKNPRSGWSRLLRGVIRLAFLASSAACVVWVFLGPWQLPARCLAVYWQSKLPDVPDEQIAGRLERIDRLGPAGLPVLVRAAGSPRVPLADAATHLIDKRLREAAAADDQTAGRFVTTLAAELDGAYADYAPERRAQARRLAERLLQWPVASRHVDTQAVADHCCNVLFRTDRRRAEAAGQDRLLALPLPVESTLWMLGDTGFARHRRALEDETDAPVVLRIVSRGESGEAPAGGKTPAGENPLREKATTPAHAEDSDREIPQQLPQSFGPTAMALDAPGRPRTLEAPLEEVDVRPLDGSRPIAPTPSSEDLLREDTASRRSATSSQGTSAEQDTLEHWMRLLSSDDRSARADAERRLRDRGFSAAEIDIARRMYHPTAAVRRQLAQELTQPPSGVDPVPVLRTLAGDADARVRSAALSVLATSQDPALRVYVLETARTDADPRIRELGRTLESQTAARRGRTFR